MMFSERVRSERVRVETSVSILGRNRCSHELREVLANGVQEKIDSAEEEEDWTDLWLCQRGERSNRPPRIDR